MLPRVVGFAGTTAQWRIRCAIQPEFPPATADLLIAATIPWTTKPSTTVAPRTAASFRHGRILTTSVSRITP